ncbi:MAG: hypothetical protein ACXWIN_08985 [Burkholderiaceae bacterium]
MPNQISSSTVHVPALIEENKVPHTRPTRQISTVGLTTVSTSGENEAIVIVRVDRDGNNKMRMQLMGMKEQPSSPTPSHGEFALLSESDDSEPSDEEIANFVGNFEIGKDFVFGLYESREVIVSFIKDRIKEDNADPTKIDIIFDDVTGRLRLDNSLQWDGDVDDHIRIDDPLSVEPRKVGLTNFDNQFLDFVDSHDKKNKELPGTSNVTHDSIAAMCKIAIDFCRKYERKIHFLLEGIDIDMVANKINFLDNEKYVNITGSELRAIFRLWRTNPNLVDHVIFYNKKYQQVRKEEVFDARWDKYKYSLARRNESTNSKIEQTWRLRPDALSDRPDSVLSEMSTSSSMSLVSNDDPIVEGVTKEVIKSLIKDGYS